MHELDIPEILRRARGDQEPLKGKRLRWTRDMHFKTEKRVIPADVRAFMKEEEKRRKAAMAERFAMLKERAALAKRQMVRA